LRIPLGSCLAALLIATPLHAQSSDAPPIAPGDAPMQGRDFVLAGAGLTLLTQYEGSKDYEILPMPGVVGEASGVAFTVIGPRASVDLFSVKLDDHWHVSVGPSIGVNMNRTHLSTISDLRIRALGKIKGAIEVGGSLDFVGSGVITSAYDRLSFSVGVRHDVAGAYDGSVVTPALTYLAPLSRRTMVVLLAQADRADSRYAGTYFSITPAQSTASTLPAFNARGGWKDWTLGAAIDHSLTGDLTHGLSLVAGGSYTRLVNDFAASPVVSVAGSPNQFLAGVGLAYAF